MDFDTVIRHAEPIVPGAPRRRADIGIREGRIVALAEAGTLPAGLETVDAGGKPVLPGVIDAHTHLGYWGDFEREMETETAGAAVGGVTTAILMLKMKNLPPALAARPSYLEIFADFCAIVERHSLIDLVFRPYPLSPRQIHEIPACVEHMGARGFKFIMHFPPGGLEAEMSGAYALDDGRLLEALRAVGQAGGIACVHAENQELIEAASGGLQAAGRDDLSAWAAGRPPLSELEAIQRVSLLADAARCPLYIVHVSAAASVDFIAWAKRQGRRIRAETCPHYLTIVHDDPIGKLAKQKPPIRDHASLERLWRGIAEGAIDCVSSDHMPSRRQERHAESIWTCQWGFPAIETLLPLLLSEGVRRGRLSLERVVEATSLNPARIFGLYPRKGHLGLGADADLVIVDTDRRVVFRQQALPSSSDFSLYDGREIVGWPTLTMVRGRIVMRDGEIVAKAPGGGRYIPQQELVL